MGSTIRVLAVTVHGGHDGVLGRLICLWREVSIHHDWYGCSRPASKLPSLACWVALANGEKNKVDRGPTTLSTGCHGRILNLVSANTDRRRSADEAQPSEGSGSARSRRATWTTRTSTSASLLHAERKQEKVLRTRPEHAPVTTLRKLNSLEQRGKQRGIVSGPGEKKHMRPDV